METIEEQLSWLTLAEQFEIMCGDHKLDKVRRMRNIAKSKGQELDLKYGVSACKILVESMEISSVYPKNEILRKFRLMEELRKELPPMIMKEFNTSLETAEMLISNSEALYKRFMTKENSEKFGL